MAEVMALLFFLLLVVAFLCAMPVIALKIALDIMLSASVPPVSAKPSGARPDDPEYNRLYFRDQLREAEVIELAREKDRLAKRIEELEVDKTELINIIEVMLPPPSGK